MQATNESHVWDFKFSKGKNNEINSNNKIYLASASKITSTYNQYF